MVDGDNGEWSDDFERLFCVGGRILVVVECLIMTIAMNRIEGVKSGGHLSSLSPYSSGFGG